MISDNALIVHTEIQSTTLKVTDKQAGAELTAQKRASKKSARVVKALIDPAYLKPIIAVQTAFRTYLQSNTVPWLGDTYLLPKTRFYEFNEKVGEFRDQLDKEVARFINSYARMINEAANSLGDLFDSSAYPEIFDLRSKFAINVKYTPVPDINQFGRLGLEDEALDKLKVEALEAENELLRDATRSLYERVLERLEMLYNRLADPGSQRYRESLVTGLEFLVEIMPELNITGDQNLISIMDQINKMLGGFTIDEVRESEDVRSDVAAQCDDIIKKMSAFM